jgi:PadR family transcriptional regulator, regulatory protein PadR
MPPRQLGLIQGTLDLLVLKTLAARTLHGYAVATAIHDRTDGALAIDDAALYQSLHRLERQRLVASEWGPSENNRRARYYTLTQDGRRRLREQEADFRRYARAVFAVLEA